MAKLMAWQRANEELGPDAVPDTAARKLVDEFYQHKLQSLGGVALSHAALRCSKHPLIVLATTAMAALVLRHMTDQMDLLAIDEAGMVSASMCLALLGGAQPACQATAGHGRPLPDHDDFGCCERRPGPLRRAVRAPHAAGRRPRHARRLSAFYLYRGLLALLRGRGAPRWHVLLRPLIWNSHRPRPSTTRRSHSSCSTCRIG